MAKGGQERLAKVAELGLNEDKVARERSGKGTAGRGHSQCRDTEAGTSQGHSRRVSPGNGGGRQAGGRAGAEDTGGAGSVRPLSGVKGTAREWQPRGHLGGGVWSKGEKQWLD